MAKIKVEFKYFEEFNWLAEKYERTWAALGGKQLLQIVLEKLDVVRVREAVGDLDAAEFSEMWISVSLPYFLYLFPHFL